MLPHKHALISAAIGVAGWWATRDPRAGAAALAAGVLPDLDHGVDYAYYGLRKRHRLILPLHGYEYAAGAALAALATRNRLLGVAALAYLVHLLADQQENHTHWLGYSLLFRLWHGFRIEAISTVPEAAARGREADLRLLRSLAERLRARIYPA